MFKVLSKVLSKVFIYLKYHLNYLDIVFKPKINGNNQ